MNTRLLLKQGSEIDLLTGAPHENSVADILPSEGNDEEGEEDHLTNYKADEMLNGFQNGEFGHVITLLVSTLNRDAFVADDF